MRRPSLAHPFVAALAGTLLVACSGSPSASGGTSAVNVARVTLDVPSNVLAVGETVRITATTSDAQGNVLTFRPVTWTSSAPAVASVSSTGTVSGLTVGASTITATSNGISATTLMTVTTPSGPCTLTTAQSMTVGEVRVLAGSLRSAPCLTGGSQGSDYAVVAVNSDSVGSARPVTYLASGVSTVQTSLLRSAPGESALSGLVLPAVTSSDAEMVSRVEIARQRTSRRVLGAHFASARAEGAGGASLKGVVGTPTVGTILRLNANGDGVNGDPCVARASDFHAARVAAVSTRAIVVVDTLSPAGGITDTEFASLAVTFDTLVYPVLTGAFGTPSDMDQNSRVVLFFTPMVNALTPQTASYTVGGFFTPRDLYPSAGAGSSSCAGSNEAEMFYLPVLDPNRVYNNQFSSRSYVLSSTINTVGHEFQHLINWSRRLYVTGAGYAEDVFLDEGLSHLAEELLFYRTSGLAAGADITYAQSQSTTQIRNAFASYQYDNMQRLALYMMSPASNSPYARNDSLATRGATWGLLRYLLDQVSGSPTLYTQALVNSNREGLANLAYVFGGTIPTAAQMARQFSFSLLTDGSTVPVSSAFAFKSWDLRTIQPMISNTPLVYPLVATSLVNGTSSTASVIPGGASYVRFTVPPSAAGGVAITSAGEPVNTAITLLLVRTR